MKPRGISVLCLLFSLYTSTTAVGETAVIRELFGFPCNSITGACLDGASPQGSLVQASDGNFYGTATRGGAQNANDGGTVYKISPSGQFTLLDTFAADANGNFSNGSFPVGSLVEGNDGFLYGATANSGARGAGVIFKINKLGEFRLLHSFCSASLCADGSNPTSLVLGNDGNLYGGTMGGGASNNGTIFRMTTAGFLTTLHTLKHRGWRAAERSINSSFGWKFLWCGKLLAKWR